MTRVSRVRGLVTGRSTRPSRSTASPDHAILLSRRDLETRPITARRRGRPTAPEALVVGKPTLNRPESSLALEVVELLAEALYQDVTVHSVETPTGCARSGSWTRREGSPNTLER